MLTVGYRHERRVARELLQLPPAVLVAQRALAALLVLGADVIPRALDRLAMPIWCCGTNW